MLEEVNSLTKKDMSHEGDGTHTPADHLRESVQGKMSPRIYRDRREAEKVDFSKQPDRDKPNWAGIMPQLGRNLFSMVVSDLNNAYIAGASLVTWVIDIIIWLFLPVIGGFVGLATFIAFESDKLTFHHMGLDQSKLYMGEMLFLKYIVLSAMGRKDFFQENPEAPTYYPLRDMNPTVIPKTVTKAPEEIERAAKKAKKDAGNEATEDDATNEPDVDFEDDDSDNAFAI